MIMMRVLQANSERVFFKHDSLEKNTPSRFEGFSPIFQSWSLMGILVLSKKLRVFFRMVILEYLTFFKGGFYIGLLESLVSICLGWLVLIFTYTVNMNTDTYYIKYLQNTRVFVESMDSLGISWVRVSTYSRMRPPLKDD